MPKFAYAAIDAQGAPVEGVTKAETIGAARSILVDQNLFPTKIEERRGMLDFELTAEKVKKKELMHFTRQLAVFVKAGIPLTDALVTIGDETEDIALRRALGAMIDDLRNGGLLSATAANHPEAFPDYYVGILQSAELTGQPRQCAREPRGLPRARNRHPFQGGVRAVVPHGGHGARVHHCHHPRRIRAAAVQAAVRGTGRRVASPDPHDAVLRPVLRRSVVRHHRKLHVGHRYLRVPVQDREGQGRERSTRRSRSRSSRASSTTRFSSGSAASWRRWSKPVSHCPRA